MKRNLSLLAIFVFLGVLMSSCGLHYSDQGRPLDFLKAKKYKAAKKELVSEDSDSEERELAFEEDEVKETNKKKGTLGADLPLWAYILLAIFIGPLAIGLYEGITNRFWLDLILYIVGAGVGVLISSPIAWAASVAAFLLALFVVLDII